MRIVTLALFIGAGVAGCGGGGAGGDAVYNDAVTEVDLKTAPGFIAPPPTGAACGRGNAEYTLTVTGRQLAYHYCKIANQGRDVSDYQKVDGSRALSDAEWDSLLPALHGLTRDYGTGCGADKGELSLTVTSGSDSVSYQDGFYACQANGKPVLTTDSLDALDAAFVALLQ